MSILHFAFFRIFSYLFFTSAARGGKLTVRHARLGYEKWEGASVASGGKRESYFDHFT